ncbi:hypothetical protein SME41J_36720 [Serratia marcescens]|nr:hypothetical protein SME41J_36720 [Serratia marcescens]
MKVNIRIKDNNIYFKLGLIHLLENYFFRHRKEGLCLKDKQKKEPIEIIFNYLSQYHKGCYCRQDVDNRNNGTLLFSIRENQRLDKKPQDQCHSEAGVLYHSDNIETVYQLLDKALAARYQMHSISSSCPPCSTSRLTPRERQVMNYLCTGISQSQVAEHMHLSVKTINAHKQSLMRKMNFKKKQDFIYWLINRENNIYDYVN